MLGAAGTDDGKLIGQAGKKVRKSAGEQQAGQVTAVDF
jgi:hypothetical protein